MGRREGKGEMEGEERSGKGERKIEGWKEGRERKDLVREKER